MTGWAPPRFWWRPDRGAAALALTLLGAAYGAVAARRMARPGTRLDVPVLCIGNFVVGGAGKTPTAIEIAHHLIAYDHNPAFVSRGYGRMASRTAAPIAVDPRRHGPAEVGDEPLLLARVAPCVVADDRVAAARAAIAAGATIVLMDDGLQNPGLAKDAGIVAVDGATGIGNGLCLPAGPLRAPLGRQWRAVDLVVIIGRGEAGDAVAAEAEREGKPVLRAGFEADGRALQALRGRPLMAFSGIGRPGKFFDTLDEARLDVRQRLPFPDHHLYTAVERERLLRSAAEAGATLVTTEKDSVRLPPGFPAAVLPVRLRFADPSPLDDLLGRLVTTGR